MTPRKIFEKGAWPGSRDPLNFWALNANCSKTVKDTDLKFDKHIHRDSPDMTPEKNLEMGHGEGHVNPAAANSLGGYMHSERLLVYLFIYKSVRAGQLYAL